MQISKTDIELVEELKNGNKIAYNEIVKRYEKKIYFLIKRMVEDPDDTNDVMQDVFIKAYLSINSFRADSGFYTWLYRIAVNTSINFIRKKKIKNFIHYDELIVPLIEKNLRPDETIEKKEEKVLIEKAIQSLPKMQKITFIMRYYDELSYEEISKVLKKSVGALKANYFHAFKKIEEYIKNEMQRV